jgi:hypothetical protein
MQGLIGHCSIWAVVVPDICAALESNPTAKFGTRYINWCAAHFPKDPRVTAGAAFRCGTPFCMKGPRCPRTAPPTHASTLNTAASAWWSQERWTSNSRIDPEEHPTLDDGKLEIWLVNRQLGFDIIENPEKAGKRGIPGRTVGTSRRNEDSTLLHTRLWSP